jgi:tetratricopeptide (TPR) repeat protein
MCMSRALMIIWLLTNLMVLISCSAKRPNDGENNASYHYTEGINHYNKREYRASLNSLMNAINFAPDNAKFMYHLARAYALVGQNENAIQWLDKTVSLGFHFDVDTDSDFDAVRKLPEYKGIYQRIQEIRRPINSSKIAFTIPEKDLMPESIAYDPIGEIFFVGSSYRRKIISIDKTGVQKDFAAENQDGLWSVWGMKVDSDRRVLWVASSVYRGMTGFDYRQFGISCIHKYDLKERRCIKKYVLDERPKHHNFNDLALNGEGDLFITDDLADTIYWISQKAGQLDVFVRPIHVSHPNGICLSEDGRYLYITHSEGISVIDVGTRACRELLHPANVTLCGIDGLYFYHNCLIGIQVYSPERVIRFCLTSDLKAVERSRIIEVNNPYFDLPTTGVIVKDTLYYVANSQLRHFNDEDGTIYPMEKLHDIVILKAKL